jgi:mRNA interferase MazF
MTKPKPSEIWLVNFPFSDLTSSKLRPALILSVHHDELIISGIFSKVVIEDLHETWVLITDTHPEFIQTGLKKTSLN